MNDTLYEKLYNAFKNYLSSGNINVNLTHFMPTKEAKFPLIILEEIRNVPIFVAKVGRQTASSIGLKFSIYAKSVGTETNQSIANNLVQEINRFMFTLNGIARASKNMIPNPDGNNSLYRIEVVYNLNTYDNGDFVY
jgi:hypothetical protein